jgi:hypothetical protein
MKLTSHFNTFLSDTVNLNQHRLDLLESSVEAIKTFVRESEWLPRVRGFIEQGSWAHGTIIRPVANSAFDADLVVYVDPVQGWDAAKYLDELYAIFKGNGTYKDKVVRWSHCVTIEYVGERKIDITPCVKGRLQQETWEVCNRVVNRFEPSAPRDYTNWITERNTWSGGNSLKKATRLIKYLRDIKRTFTCPSFLLTTLLGDQVRQGDNFADVPSALKAIFGRLDDVLQSHAVRPAVLNPALRTEKISGVWDDAKYKTFRDRMHQYRGWIDDAFDETDRDMSVRKWQRVFGDEFAADVVLKEAAAVSDVALQIVRASVTALHNFTGDLVDLVKRIGVEALPAGFDRLPHMQAPAWTPASSGNLKIFVGATKHAVRDGPSLGPLASLAPITNGQWIKFNAHLKMGMPLPEGHFIKWRVSNTDKSAQSAGALRGGFYDSDRGNIRWEATAYRGVHVVEAFVIRRSDSRLVGNSPPFYVVVD